MSAAVFGVFIYTKFREYRTAPSGKRGGGDGSQENPGKETEPVGPSHYITVEVR